VDTIARFIKKTTIIKNIANTLTLSLHGVQQKQHAVIKNNISVCSIKLHAPCEHEYDTCQR